MNADNTNSENLKADVTIVDNVIVNSTVWKYLDDHADDDIDSLALHAKLPWKQGTGESNAAVKTPRCPDLAWVLQQISGRQIAARKLPSWAQMAQMLYPSRVPMEQCSSQQAADYKAQLVLQLVRTLGRGEVAARFTVADLTGGFGVDCAAIAQHAEHAYYVERNEQLCTLVEHNYEQLGLGDHVEVHHGDARDFLASMPSVDVIMLDPARRDAQGKRTYALVDCEPNVLELLGELAQKAHFVLLKLSPMLDWHKTVADLAPFASEVHIVSVKNECKELLVVLDMHRTSQDYQREHLYRLVCVDLGAHVEQRRKSEGNAGREGSAGSSDNASFEDSTGSASREASEGSGGNESCEASPCSASCVSARTFTVCGEAQMNAVTPVRKNTDNLEGQLLWEPNASVMKAGCFGAFAQAFGVEAVGENSHLFVGGFPEIASTIPAKGFVIEQVCGFSKKEVRELTTTLTHANIVVRNAPFTPASLRKKLKLKDGSDVTLFATTNARNEHVLIRAKRVASE